MCELGDGKGVMTYLTKDTDKRDEFEKRFGDFKFSLRAIFNYNQALKRAVGNLELFETMKRA